MRASKPAGIANSADTCASIRAARGRQPDGATRARVAALSKRRDLAVVLFDRAVHQADVLLEPWRGNVHAPTRCFRPWRAHRNKKTNGRTDGRTGTLTQIHSVVRAPYPADAFLSHRNCG